MTTWILRVQSLFVSPARVSRGSHGFGVAEDADGEVLDVCGPLRRELEKLDVVPFNTVDRHSQHGVLVFGGADQAADSIDHLAFRVQLLLFRLLTQKNHFLVLLLGHHSHGHAGGRGQLPSAGQSAHLQRPEVTL